MGPRTTGLILAAALVLVVWALAAFMPEVLAEITSALPTASALLGFGVAAIGAVSGSQAVVGGRWQDAAPGGAMVLGGGLLTLASSLM